MDWDRLRIFHAVAEAGSFTHAADALDLSQSAVSRQVSALERELAAPLFHRHARGLVLTEQGEILFRTAQDVSARLTSTEIRIQDARLKPSGDLRVTAPVGIGTNWLTPRLGEFIVLYPDIMVQLLLQDDELDLGMREADVAIRFGEPTQGDMIRRRLFTVNFHVYASRDYIRRFGAPAALADLDTHRVMTYGGTVPSAIRDVNWLELAGRDGAGARVAGLRINSLVALARAVRSSVGIALLPDYMANNDETLVKLMPEVKIPNLETFFVYPEGLKTSKRVNVFRDFLVQKAREWSF